MKVKSKSIAFLLVLILLCSIIAPTINVFAASGVTVNVTSSGIVSQVVISEKENIEEGGAKKEGSTEQGGTCSINFDYDFSQYYISVEPDFFAGGRITSIKINGQTKDVAFPTGKNVYKVSGASTYNVEVVGVVEQHYNIMWANDGAKVEGTDFNDPEVLLQNGSARIVKVYDNANDMKDISNEIEHIDEGCLDPNGRGYVSLSEGNVVIFEFTPKYGYQLTSVSANGTKLEAQKEMNQYKSEDLQTPAVITLKLDEGVDGNTVVLIHEKEDGTYETIETTYDEATHTISFSTSSFSNYAIASKKTENTANTETDNKVDNIANPETGDNIVLYGVVFAIALTGILGIFIINKKKVKNNK